MEDAALPLTDKHVDLALVLHSSRHNAQTNPFCPISRLPAELLEIIFIHNARDSYVYGKYGDSMPTAPSWANVSYVCRHWRDVALGCPSLWTYIPRTSQRWSQELLARSKNVPLKVYGDLRPGDEPSRVLSIIEQVMNHVERIQTLYLHLPGLSRVRDSRILSKFLFSCAPCLEYLDLLGLNTIEEPEVSLLHFGGETPALRILKLMDCSLPWYSFRLNDLTVLELSDPYLQQTMTEFLIVLCCMPSLVYLSLHDVLLEAHDFLSNGEVSATPTVNLPCLSELYVSAPISMVVAFLACVNIPLGARVFLECLDTELLDIHPFYYRQLSSLLTQRITASNDPALVGPTIRSMVIHNRHQINMHLTFSTLECEHEIPPMYSTKWDHNTPLCVKLYPETVDEEDRMLDDFYGSIPLTNIQSIHFIGPVCSLDLWEKMSRWLPNLRHIKLSEGYMPDITSLLFLPSHHGTENLGGDVDQGRNGIFAPELEELELHSVCLSKVPTSVCKDNLTPPELRSLCEAVSTRKETRCRLTINECCVYADAGVVVLEVLGRWENGQFKVTSKHTYKELPDK